MVKRGICILCKEVGVELTEHHATNNKGNISTCLPHIKHPN